MQVIGQVSSVALNESTDALKRSGEEAIHQKALSVARQVELYLEAHPERLIASAKELEADKTLADIAVQPVGKTGYTALYDSNAVTHFHTNPALIGVDLHTLASTRPAFWRIMEASLSGTPVDGYYKWQEADGSWRDKYMSCMPVGNTQLRIAATTYLDEFYQPILDTGAKISDLSRSTEQRLFGIVAFVGVAVLLVAIGTAAMFVRPINRVMEGARQLSQGKLDYEIPRVGGDEMGQLAKTFNQMARQLQQLVNQTTSHATRLERQATQLAAGVAVARAASSILDPQELLKQAVNLICDQFGLYYAGIFLLDKENRFAVLRAGRGEAGRAMLESGHRLEVGGQSMVGWVCANRQARIALDVGQDAVRLVNPLLPDTRSEIALPLQIGERVLGALDVQSKQEAAFDESSIAVLQGMADQIAIALENARLFAETQTALAENQRLVSQIQASLQETSALYETSQAIATAPDTDAIFQAMVEHGLKPEIDLCLLVLFEPYEGEKPEYLKVSHVWTREPVTLDPLRADTRTAFADFSLRSLLTAEPSGLVQSYDPGDQQMWRHLPPGLQSIAFVPLIAGAKWTGALGLGTSSQSALTAEWLKPYQSLAAQAAVSIENRRLIESTQASLQELNVLYRQVMRETWQRALQSRPTLTEYDYAPTGQAAGDGSKLEMPLTLRGQEIGVVELTSAGRQAWTEQERALVEAVVTQAALALDSARLFDETQRLAGRERLINEITARIRATTSVSAILQTAARELAQALDVPHAVARIQIDESARPVTKSGG